jgi:hypothetical protein
MLAVRPRRLNLPPLEDANAVMLWLMEVSRALLEGEITERTAGLLFYGLQMAMATARWTTFAQTKPEEMVRSADFTAKGAKDAEKEGPGGNVEQPQRKPVVAVRERVAALQVNPGHPPHHANPARVGDPGDESAKSLCFGVEHGGEVLRLPSVAQRHAQGATQVEREGREGRADACRDHIGTV